MSKRLTYEYVKEFFEKEGCELLEKEYINAHTKVGYVTQCGHVNKIRFFSFKKGFGRYCLKCSKIKQSKKYMLKYSYIKNYFKKEGCKLLEKKYINSRTKLKYIAKCGHENVVSFDNFKNKNTGRLCPKCVVLFGENHPNWNSNLTSKDRIKKRYLQKNKTWRKKVFERDDYICQITGERGGRLVAHHLKPYYKYKDFRFEVSNGITLNKEFHIFCHRIFGYKAEIGPSELVECHYLWDNGKGIKYI